ncbi:type IX secretion system sortase PorU [soil metagenome]
MLNTKSLFSVFVTAALITACLNVSAQVNRSELNRSTTPKSPVVSSKQDAPVPDFKITGSTDSYIEIEFTPQYITANPLNKSGDIRQNFISFLHENINGDKPGSPDVRSRSFPVFLPSEINNVQILDAKYSDLSGLDIRPIPSFEKNSPKKNKTDDKIPNEVFIKDPSYYSINKFYPESPASLSKTGIFRDKYYSNIIIYPVQYNPVTGIGRKYTYLKVRINFTSAPKLMTRQLSTPEKEFISGLTVNYSEAMNWTSGKENQNGIVNSIFASGDFYKIEVNESGIFKIDKAFLTSAGINVTSINPKTIKIYGNGGAELPFNNGVAVPLDPVENRIYVAGEDDNTFNDNDYILFYAKSPNDWTYNDIDRTYSHYLNHYSKSNYYFITFGGNNGLRMNSIPSFNISGLQPVQSFTDRLFDDPEVNNLGSTGTLWISQRIGLNEAFSFNKDLKGYVDGSNVNLRLRLANGSSSSMNFSVSEANSSMQTSLSIFTGQTQYGKITMEYLANNWRGIQYPLSPGKTSTAIRVSAPSSFGNTSLAAGYYDYAEILYDRSFNSADNGVLRFNSPDTSGTVQYSVSPFSGSDAMIFDVTDFKNCRIITPQSVNNGIVRFQDTTSIGNVKQYIVINNGYKTPVSISSKLENQNLKGTLNNGSSFIIFSPKEFLNSANRLKNYRQSAMNNSLNTVVVDVDKVYNEFSAGIADPVAMRNFIKYAYTNWTEKPVYVLFFGDGSYDYKNIYSLSVKNFMPPIEHSSDQMSDLESYCSDDFFVDINENNDFPTPVVPDFSSGRLCVNSDAEGNIAVDKIISYENPATFDKWRDKLLFVADDGWTTEATHGEEGDLHTAQSEQLAELHTPPYFEKEKIYIVTYPAIYTPQGRRKPQVNIDIVNSWNEGRLVINYVGHGSTDLWAHEHIFERQVSIPLLHNKDKYPFVTIASCDLARWDDPFSTSAAEELVNIKDKGAVGIIAAVRAVFSNSNAAFNNLLYDSFMFQKEGEHLPIRTGRAMFNAKQPLAGGDNDSKFVLLCDPTVRIGIQYFTKIDSINNTSTDDLFEMKALQRVKVSGRVLRADSTFWSDYNGDINLKVFDVDKFIDFVDFDIYHFNFRRDGGIIYSGKGNVSNGRWSIEFIVPRDISYSGTGRGKMLNYFKNSSTEGVGYTNSFTVNGIDASAPVDTTPPVLTAYLNSRNFRSGDMVNQNPKLVLDISDQSGINLTGTIGHKIEAILNDDNSSKIDLTQLYNSTSGFQQGSLEYQFSDLPAGRNNLKLVAYDSYNNQGITSIDFNVQSSSNLVLNNVYNFPNPMRANTSFLFQHNLDLTLNMNIKIYTVSGRLIKELNKNNISDKFVSVDWDGKDSDGDEIANGTYLYKLTVRSLDGTFSQSQVNKLAKLK